MLRYLAAGLLALVCVAGLQADQPHRNARTITVNGDGTASAVPDVGYIHLAVVTDHDTVSKAMAKNKESSANVFAALKKNKVADKDVCTHNFSVSPKYKYAKDEEPKLIGYTVTNELKVTVRDLEKAGDLLDALTAEGHANNVSSVTFDVLDKTKVTDNARESAVADAVRRAKLLAKASGCKLGKVLSISEGGGYSPRPYSFSAASVRSESGSLARGEQQFRASVNIVFALED